MHHINKGRQFLFGDIKDRFSKALFSVEESLRETFIELFVSMNFSMKTCSFLVTFSLALVLANAMSTEEHVRRAFPMKHRHLLPEITSLQLQDAPAMVPKQNDESTQCLAKCEPECQRVNVPAFLKVKIFMRH